MTTTIGIVCKDGIILATDTRATMGFFVAHKRARKVYKIDDHLAMTVAGVVADAQNVVDILRANARLYRIGVKRPMPVNAAARLTANILFSSRFTPLGVQSIVAGVDGTGPHLYSIDPLGSLIDERCLSTGSGSPIAYGVLEDEYQEGQPIDKMLPVVLRAVRSAMKRDVASGDSFDVAVITEEGYRELSEEEKGSIK